jgi:hypothetical protein
MGLAWGGRRFAVATFSLSAPSLSDSRRLRQSNETSEASIVVTSCQGDKEKSQPFEVG